MRPSLLLSVLVLLAFAPLATATCHACLEAVAEDCGALAGEDCVESAGYAATHLPHHVLEEVSDLEDLPCDRPKDPACS